MDLHTDCFLGLIVHLFNIRRSENSTQPTQPREHNIEIQQETKTIRKLINTCRGGWPEAASNQPIGMQGGRILGRPWPAKNHF